MKPHPIFDLRYGLILPVILVLAACNSGPAPTPLPSVTPIPTFHYIPPTEAAIVLTVVAATPSTSATLDADSVELGKGRYVALQCGSCHGDDGKGTSKGSALVGTKLSQDDFVNMLRSGGKLGNDHLYSTNRLSDAGSKNLYLYVLSLSSGSPH